MSNEEDAKKWANHVSDNLGEEGLKYYERLHGKPRSLVEGMF